ncbi:MAG: CotH kinase family protein, partial [Treponema sp.]|nr:CotH kinase family protein [Treponema sp.]
YSADKGTLSYQWHKTEDGTDTAIAGETKSSCTVTAEKVGSAEFYCVVTNTIADNGDGGTKTATARSNSAKVTVSRIDVQKPVILTTLEDVALHVPEKATLTVSAYATDGGTLSYQWYKTEDDKTAAIEGATESAYDVVAEKVGSAEFYCVVTNTITDNGDGGTKTATARSNSAKVTVSRIDVQKPVILTELKDVSLHVPEKTTLIVLAYSTDGGKLSYQWYKTEDDKTAAIEGATESAYDAVAEKVGSAEFYCVVTSTITDNGDGGVKTDYVLSNSAKITVEQVDVQKPVIKMQPKDATVVIPAIQAFSVNAYAADDGILTYQWYSVPDGQTAGTAIEGETNARLIVRVQELGKTGYYCIVTNTIDDNGDGGTKLASVQTGTAWFDAIYLKNVVSAPAFTKQPPALNVAPYNQHIEISCEAESAQGNVSYRWYQSTDGTTDTGIPVIGATTQTLTTPFYTERGIHYYYCVATTILSAEDGESIKSAASFSDIVTVACTGLPLLTITTVNGEEPTCDYKASPTGWGAGITNATKVPARMIMTRGNETVYDSGDYIAKTSGLTIKIRGNTSAYGIKKPYKLKLQKKADLLKHKRDDVNDHSDKNWILLRDATSLKTKVGLKVADKVGFAWTPTYDYVDVLMNGTYRGVYMLIESIERADCRINVKKNGFIIERDAYWWNEDLYFETEDSMKASWKYTFKYPDTDGDIAEGDENFEYIKDYVNTAWNTLSDGTYESYIDVDSFAKWLIAHDILGSKDWAGSNIYLSKYDQTDTSKLQMETPWDFDTIYSMNEAWSNIHIVKGFFFPFLFANTNKAFVAQYKQKWADVKDSVWADIKTDLNAFAAETEEGLNIARKLDAEKYGITYKTVSEDIADAENWFSSRLTWLNTQITALSE